MSSFDRRRLILMPLALAGCGFAPVYGPGGAGKRLYGAVTIVTPATEESYLLYRELEERLGHATAPDYRLALTPSITAQGQAVTAAGETTRFSLVGRVLYSLHRLSDDQVVASGDVENFVGYSATGSTVEALAAENDAKERLMSILADQISSRILATAELSQ